MELEELEDEPPPQAGTLRDRVLGLAVPTAWTQELPNPPGAHSSCQQLSMGFVSLAGRPQPTGSCCCRSRGDAEALPAQSSGLDGRARGDKCARSACPLLARLSRQLTQLSMQAVLRALCLCTAASWLTKWCAAVLTALQTAVRCEMGRRALDLLLDRAMMLVGRPRGQQH